VPLHAVCPVLEKCMITLLDKIFPVFNEVECSLPFSQEHTNGYYPQLIELVHILILSFKIHFNVISSPTPKYLDNVGPSTSHNPMVLHGLLQG
jgi:hypothetical protein